MNRYSGQVAVMAGILIMICLGTAYAWGVFMIPIDAEMGWGRASISFAVSVLLLVFSVFMFIAGILEKKIGAFRTSALGGLLVGLGWISASFAQSPAWLNATYGVMTGIGTGLCYMISVSTGIKWFPERKGMVTGLIVFGFGFGTAFLSPLVTYSIDSLGWRGAMQMFGAVFMLVIVAMSFLLKRPEGVSTASDGKAGLDKALKIVRSGKFKVLFISYLLAMVAGMMAIGHIAAFAMGEGFSPIQAAFALTVMSLFNGIGRISFGAISDKAGVKPTLVMLFFSIAVSVLMLLFASSLSAIYLVSGLIGLFFGGFLAVYPPATLTSFGSNDFSISYGLVFIGYGLGCFIGPLAAGYIFDITAGYDVAFFLGSVSALLGGVLVLLKYKDTEVKS